MKIGRLVPETIKAPVRRFQDYLNWTSASRNERRRDITQGLGADPGNDAVIQHGLDWIALAQDKSRSQDGGVARHYSLQTGWGASYPETTGYIIPTFLEHARHRNDPQLRERASQDAGLACLHPTS